MATDVILRGDVRSSLLQCAESAAPSETGGLLLGWRDSDTVLIADFIELTSRRPRRRRYEIAVDEANSSLTRYLATASNKLVGYVGAWHSHPALAGPSETDRGTFRSATLASSEPLAFIVAATDGIRSTLFITWAARSGDEVFLNGGEVGVP